MNKEQFIDWQESYVTEIVFKYLIDKIRFQAENIAETIVSGGVVDETFQREIAAESVAVRDLVEIEYNEIEDFYRKEEDEDSQEKNNAI